MVGGVVGMGHCDGHPPFFFFFKTTQDKRTRMSDGRYGKRSKTKRKCHFATITKKMSPHRKGGSSPSRLQMTVRILPI